MHGVMAKAKFKLARFRSVFCLGLELKDIAFVTSSVSFIAGCEGACHHENDPAAHGNGAGHEDLLAVSDP